MRVYRLKRKSPVMKTVGPEQEFNNYLQKLPTTHRLTYQDGTDVVQDSYYTQFLEKMNEEWNKHSGDCQLMEALTGLQASLQSICENLVLLDRVEFLKENGFECDVRKVTNNVLSPRCYALVVVKSGT